MHVNFDTYPVFEPSGVIFELLPRFSLHEGIKRFWLDLIHWDQWREMFQLRMYDVPLTFLWRMCPSPNMCGRHIYRMIDPNAIYVLRPGSVGIIDWISKHMCQKRSYFKANRVGLYEPPHNITNNLHMPKTKAQISCAVTAQLISAFVFATRVVLSPISLVSGQNPPGQNPPPTLFCLLGQNPPSISCK